jgi:hypothetical protein
MNSSGGCGEAIVMKAHLPSVAILRTRHSLIISPVNAFIIWDVVIDFASFLHVMVTFLLCIS